jgi:hypothetical protein
MDRQADRIKLAEAMGWEWKPWAASDPFFQENVDMGFWHLPNGQRAELEKHVIASGKETCPPFDPFTDANDDYAVLEWMRESWKGKEGHHGHWHQAAQRLWWRWDEYAVDVPYQIGDYARAALKVIDQ